MAQPKTARGTKVHILQGNGAGPEVFAAYCGLNAKTFNFRTQTNTQLVPDCDNPDDPAWQDVTKSGRSLQVTGTGLLDTVTALPAYRAAYASPDPAHYRMEIGVPLASGGGHWAASMQLTDLTITGNDNELTTVSITLESSGPVLWVPATA